MDRPNPSFAVSASASAAQERLPQLLKGTADRRMVLEYCLLARQVGVGVYLLSGMPIEMYGFLGRSSSAWAHYFSAAPEEDRLLGCFEPILDGIASGDSASIGVLAETECSLQAPLEYEEEHLYARLLLDLARGTDPVGEALERYEELDPSDLRLAACAALAKGDADALAQAAGEFAEGARTQLEQQVESGRYDVDHRATTGRVSVELIAWARLARDREMPWPAPIALCPATALRFDLASPVSSDSWRSFPLGGA